MPLPINIDPNESVRFSPQRARDISSTAISTNIWNQRSIDRSIDITVDSSPRNDAQSDLDPHVNSYDCRGMVSLNSAMQSNVPSPFGGMHKFTHLNMPGGQWSQSNKWMSHDLHSSHYTNLRREVRKNILNDELKQQNGQGIIVLNDKTYLHGHLLASKSQSNTACWTHLMQSDLFACSNIKSQQILCRWYSSDKKDVAKSDESNKQIQHDTSNVKEEEVAITQRAKLKNAIRDYGSTVLVFHIAISLASLGIFYQLVSRYVEMKCDIFSKLVSWINNTSPRQFHVQIVMYVVRMHRITKLHNYLPQ